jgi:hypothetical protein
MYRSATRSQATRNFAAGGWSNVLLVQIYFVPTDCAAEKGAVPSRGGPMLFEFTEPERNTMRRALELYVSELTGEIVKTEKREWLQALREEKTILKGVIEQLSV